MLSSKHLAFFFFIATKLTIHGGSFDAHANGTEWPGFGGPTRDFRVSGQSDLIGHPALGWSIQVGEGRSGVVTDGRTLYVTSLTTKKQLRPDDETPNDTEKEPELHETVSAIAATTGKLIWRHFDSLEELNSQQTFGGRRRAPQATPLLMSDGVTLITLGFSGRLNAFDRRDGTLLWSMSLVRQFDAVPVSFGYSASPIEVDGKVLVLAGGHDSQAHTGGLVLIDVHDGSVLAEVPCGEASYATPVVATLDGVPQVIFVTREFVSAVSLEESTQERLGGRGLGDELWRITIENPGLTNVPTPLVMTDGLIFSGQGFGGTVRYRIRRDALRDWSIEPMWDCNTQFFYCNWFLRDGILWGSNGELLVAIDSEDGSRLGRFRGFGDANVLGTPDNQMMVIDGGGTLTIYNGEDASGAWSLPQGRYWTPATMTDDSLWIRGGEQLHCVRWHTEQDMESVLPNAIKNPRSLRLKHSISDDGQSSVSEESSNLLDRIVSRFESEGVDAAIETYNDIRARNSEHLTLQQLRELAKLARRVGQSDFANQLPGHAAVDLKTDEARQWLRDGIKLEPVGAAAGSRRQSVRLAIINLGSKIDAEIVGPSFHPFSYGLPLPPGRLRIETWPVGSRLSYAGSGDLIMEVKPDSDGKVVVLGP